MSCKAKQIAPGCVGVLPHMHVLRNTTLNLDCYPQIVLSPAWEVRVFPHSFLKFFEIHRWGGPIITRCVTRSGDDTVLKIVTERGLKYVRCAIGHTYFSVKYFRLGGYILEDKLLSHRETGHFHSTWESTYNTTEPPCHVTLPRTLHA